MWLVARTFLDQISQSAPVFDRKLWILMIHLTKSFFFQVIINPHKVCAILCCHNSDIATSCNEALSARINKSVSNEFVIYFNMHYSTWKACEHCTISVLLYPLISTTQYEKGSESVTLWLVSSAIFCVPKLAPGLLQIAHLLMKSHNMWNTFSTYYPDPTFLNWLNVTPLPE